jgi:DNA-binding CsgD family transcriptional regulator
MMLRAVEIDPAPSQSAPMARFSLGGSEFRVVALADGLPYPDSDVVVGTFIAGGRHYAILGRAEAEPGTDLIDLLTPRELEIACLIASGCECKEIARRLRISFHTVRVHLGRIYAKLGLHKQTELAARIALRFG